MEIRHVFFHTFLARARSSDIYNRAQCLLLIIAGSIVSAGFSQINILVMSDVFILSVSFKLEPCRTNHAC